MSKSPSFFILITVVCSLAACAQSKKARTHATGYFYAKIIEEDKGDSMLQIKPRILLVWQATEAPETFYWRADDGWTGCSVLKARRIAKAKNKDKKYTTETVRLDKIKNGDTLEIMPVYGGKNPIPADIPPTAKNMIYFKTAGTGWLSLPLQN